MPPKRKGENSSIINSIWNFSSKQKSSTQRGVASILSKKKNHILLDVESGGTVWLKVVPMTYLKTFQYRESSIVIADLGVYNILIKCIHIFSSIIVLIPLIFLNKINDSLQRNESSIRILPVDYLSNP